MVVKTFDIRDLRNYGDNVNVKKESDTRWLQTLFFLLMNKESLFSRSNAHVVGT